MDSSEVDTDPDEHRAAYLCRFASAGPDDELADALYAAESDLSLSPFAVDVGDLLGALASSGVRIGVVSDIHGDLRPVFAQHPAGDGRTWADLVDVSALSYELGVAKPDPATRSPGGCLHRDRGPWDGAEAAIGITTLVLPPLKAVSEARLHRVLDLVLPGRSRTNAL